MGKYLFKERQGARILRLSQPEHGLLAYGGILVRSRRLNHQEPGRWRRFSAFETLRLFHMPELSTLINKQCEL